MRRRPPAPSLLLAKAQPAGIPGTREIPQQMECFNMAASSNTWQRALTVLLVAGVGVLAGCDDDKNTAGGGGGGGGGGGELECEKTGVPNDETQPAEINPKLVGTYEIEYALNTKGGSFEEGDKVTIVIGEDSTLEIDGKLYCEPFMQEFGGAPNDFEIIWLDTETNIGYALTDNKNGKFSEINVGDYDKPQDAAGLIPGFLGQFREVK